MVSDYVALPILALQTAVGVMLITVSGSMYGTGLPLVNVVLLIVVAIIWISSVGSADLSSSASPFSNDDLGPLTWSAACIGVLVTLAYGGTMVLFRASIVYMPGTLFTVAGDTLLLSAIMVALRVYFV